MNDDKLLRAAYAYLERYNSSVENLRRVLLRKIRRWQQLDDRGHSSPSMERKAGPAETEIRTAVDAAVDRCIELGLVDDERYAQVKAAGMRRRGGSGRRIRAMLSAKGVEGGAIASALQADDACEAEAAQTFARRRRLGPYRTDSRRQERRDRDIASMCRAGFSVSLSIATIDGEGPEAGDE